jgi:hypothetical protein
MKDQRMPAQRVVPLECASPSYDIDDASHQQIGPLCLRHLEVITDDPDGSTQQTMLIILHLEILLHLGKLCL